MWSRCSVETWKKLLFHSSIFCCKKYFFKLSSECFPHERICLEGLERMQKRRRQGRYSRFAQLSTVHLIDVYVDKRTRISPVFNSLKTCCQMQNCAKIGITRLHEDRPNQDPRRRPPYTVPDRCTFSQTPEWSSFGLWDAMDIHESGKAGFHAGLE